MATKMRAKMRVNHIDQQHFEKYGQETLYFNPVAAKAYPADGSDENNTFAKFSPSGTLQLSVQNPTLLGKFKVGEEYYVDFTLAE